MVEDRPLEEWEFPDHEDDACDDALDHDGRESETQACPACGAEIYEDAERCPNCGEYIEFSSGALAGWPWWFVALGLLGIVAVVLALIGLL